TVSFLVVYDFIVLTLAYFLINVSVNCIFFFSSRRRHTRSKRDWSSDVCSSDLMQAEGVSQFKDGKPYITENETLVTIVEKLVEMAKDGTLLMPNSWSDYTDKAIQGDQVAGVMNGNWSIQNSGKVEGKRGKWEIKSI